MLNYRNDLDNFTRNIHTSKMTFFNSEYDGELLLCNKSTRETETKNKELSTLVNEIENLTPNMLPFKDNST